MRGGRGGEARRGAGQVLPSAGGTIRRSLRQLEAGLHRRVWR